jgi:hypothetical protein
MTQQSDHSVPANQSLYRTLQVVPGSHADWEREMVRIACVGSNAEFRAAVDRLVHRASLQPVRNSASETDDSDDSDDGNVDLGPTIKEKT